MLIVWSYENLAVPDSPGVGRRDPQRVVGGWPKCRKIDGCSAQDVTVATDRRGSVEGSNIEVRGERVKCAPARAASSQPPELAITFCAMVRLRDYRDPSAAMVRVRLFATAALMGSAAACGPRSLPAPAAVDAPPGRLPEVPLVEGPLALRVQYPDSGALIGGIDSNFIHGSIGHGRAALTINGSPVTVQPNGAFIAYLPVPDPASPRYELVAVIDGDTARLTHPVRIAARRTPFAATGAPFVDTGSVSPRGATLALRSDEAVRVSVRAAADARVWVQWDKEQHPLINGATGPEPSVGDSVPAATPARYLSSSERWSRDLPARIFQRSPVLVVARGSDTSRFRLATIELTDLGLPVWGMLGADSSTMSDTDRVVVGRSAPAGGYSWFFLPGTVVEITGRNGDFSRVRLDATLEAWVESRDIEVLPQGYASPRRSVSTMQVLPAPDWVDITIPTGERPPHAVEMRERSLVLTLYGTTITPGLVRYLENDTLVRNMVWEQEATDRARLTIHLSSPPFGYLAMWERGMFILRVRRPPAIDASAPLRGLTIVVDPGHPPAGATGPTGFYEGDAVLPVGLKLRDLLSERGANVVITRTDPGPVGLTDRPIIARRANAHALLSIHLNALPDGVNPFRANGASVLFFHPHAEPLARLVQRELIRQFGLRDLGIHFQNVALARPTWMPAILAEGLFIMMPEQEAAMRSPEGQAAYARALADGVEAFFRDMSAGR